VAEDYFISEKPSANAVPHLLFVGRLAFQKNLPLLIEAVAQMQATVFLDIVGEGELRKNIEALIQKYELQNVKLHGKKTGKELIEFYKSADVFVLPSFQEGLSLAMLEALAAGLPVVASDLPETRSILGECGVLIQDRTAANYARTLDEIVSNKSRIQELSALSVQKARSYSWVSVLNSIEGVYKEVVNGN
jgi:glycosyltransferase involved in cell wall biosynthesis